MLIEFAQRLRTYLPRNKFFLQALTLVSGTAGSQLIVIIASPLVTRLYSPEVFGEFSVFIGILSPLILFSTLRYELAIPIANNENASINLIALNLLLIISTTFCLALIIIAFNKEIITFLQLPQLAEYLYLLPIGIFFASIYRVFNYWNLWQDNFKTIASTKITQSSTMSLFQCIAYKLGIYGLIIGNIIGSSFGIITLLKPFFKKFSLYKKLSVKKIIQEAVKFRKFPFFSLPASIFNSLSTQLPVILMASLFDPLIAGLYALSRRVLILPMRVIGSALSETFLANASKSATKKDLQLMVHNIYKNLVQISIAPILVLTFLGPELFSFIFGNEWREAGIYTQWLTPWLYIIFVTTPLLNTQIIIEKNAEELIFQASLLILRVGSIFLGYYLNDSLLAIKLFSLSSTICWLLLLHRIYFNIGLHPILIFKTIIKSVPKSLLLVLPIIFYKFFQSTNLFLLGLALTFTLVMIIRELSKTLFIKN